MSEQILQLDPTKVLADSNIRFALTPARVAAMAESISARGGIMQPVEVEKLSPPQNGYTHRLRLGFYRHAAALHLNDSGAGVTLPAIERKEKDEQDRLRRQLSENLDRESMSPMDTAVAMQKMLDAGLTRQDIRQAFSRPGGRKGNVMQPLSASAVMMFLSLLKLPKPIQAKVHEGRLPFSTAYELSKLPKEQHAAILEKAEEKRLADIAREERLDEKLAKADESEVAKAEREQAVAAKIETARLELEQAQQADKDAKTARDAAEKAAKVAKSPGDLEKESGVAFGDWDQTLKTRFAERVGAAKVALRDTQKAAGEATKRLDKATRAYKALTEPKGASRTEETTQADKAEASTPTAQVKAKSTAPRPADVRQAAKDAGVGTSKATALTAAESRDAASALAKSRHSKVKAIGMVLGKLLSGEITPIMAERDLAVVTGEATKKK